jgi:hypothetical protein
MPAPQIGSYNAAPRGYVCDESFAAWGPVVILKDLTYAAVLGHRGERVPRGGFVWKSGNAERREFLSFLIALMRMGSTGGTD